MIKWIPIDWNRDTSPLKYSSVNNYKIYFSWIRVQSVRVAQPEFSSELFPYVINRPPTKIIIRELRRFRGERELLHWASSSNWQYDKQNKVAINENTLFHGQASLKKINGPTGPRAHGPTGHGPTGPRAHGPTGPRAPRAHGPTGPWAHSPGL